MKEIVARVILAGVCAFGAWVWVEAMFRKRPYDWEAEGDFPA
jgi:hypothetical protein